VTADKAALRHNVIALGADYGMFIVGLSFASQATILPAFAAYLGAPNTFIGAIPAVMTVGWLLPSLFAAGHTQTLARRLPFVLRYTVWERLPYLVMAATAIFIAERAPALALGLLLLTLLTATGVGGALMPAWMDVVGRSIPVGVRGRFFAVASVAASAAGFAGSFGTAYVLATVPAPLSFGLCFLAASVCLAISYWALLCVREPATAAPAPPVALRAYLARVPALLRGNRNLSWYLTARAFAITGMMATGFYTVYGMRVWGATPAEVGVFTTLLLAGQTAGYVTLGWLADHAGHRLVIIAGIVAALTANLTALTAPSVTLFSIVFVLAGIQMASVALSSHNVMLEFAPTPDEQPTYVGLGATAMAPVAFGAPMLAGLLADAAGFAAVFVSATACAIVALCLLVARVRDPRHLRARAIVNEAGA
jgi:MFS family permease